jgi:hypothetical protein
VYFGGLDSKEMHFFMWIEDYIKKLHSDGMLKGVRMMDVLNEM